jgi:hypothetical protein
MTNTPTRGVIERAREIKSSQAQTVDGHPRSLAEDQEINEACLRLFASGDGEIVFGWLRQISVNKVLGANSSDAELRFQEGMRCIVALIEARRVAETSRLVKNQKKQERSP